MALLDKGEKVIVRVRTARRHFSLVKFYLIAIAFFVLATQINNQLFAVLGSDSLVRTINLGVFIGLGIVFIIIGEVKREQKGTFHITDRRIIITRGIIHSTVDALAYNMVVNVRISQSLIDKLLGLGTLELQTSHGSQIISIKGIPNPTKIENLIYGYLDRPEEQRTEKPKEKEEDPTEEDFEL